MSAPICRWGILGTANIARKNWKSIRNAENATLTVVASRTEERAKQFISECQASAAFADAPAAVGSYDALLNRKDVDAVYIPLPTGIRKQWVIKAAQAGKHVLCEKPCAVHADDLREMIDACEKHKVQFMDGVMFMHGKRLPAMRQVLDDGSTVGAIKRLTSQFCFMASDEFLKQNIRVNDTLEPLGALGDLGWYNIRLSLWAMNEQLPTAVSGRTLTKHQVPLEFSGELQFANGASAGFYCSFLTEIHQWGNISGTKGVLHVDDFVLPWFGAETTFMTNQPVFNVNGCEFNMESHIRDHRRAEYSNGMPDSQETGMIRTFSQLATVGPIDPRWATQALNTQRVLDACLQSARDDGKLVRL